MFLGRSNYEQDAYRIRPLIIERTRLTRDVAATATTIYINSLPRGVGAYGGFVVIDPWTADCEVRQITNRAGKILTLASALAYDHTKYDEVIFIDRPWINALWFGAVGDNSTNNNTALYRWGVQAARHVAYLPEGTYRFGSALNWMGTAYSGISLVGDGPASILKATAAINMVSIDTGDQDYPGFRYGRVQDILLEGGSVANIGLYMGKCVKYRTEGVTVQNCTGTPGAGMVLDYSQNQYHQDLMLRLNDVNLLIVNGAANNVFINTNLPDPGDWGIHMDSNSGYPGYVAGTALGGNQNLFLGGIIEPGEGSGTAQCNLWIEYGDRNIFSGFNIGRGSAGNIKNVVLGTNSSYNIFNGRTRFGAGQNSYEPFIQSSGTGNVFQDCYFISAPSAIDAIQVDNGYVICFNNYFDPDFVPVNVTSGNYYDRVWGYVPDRMVGETADYPATGSAIIPGFYDVDLSKPVWYNPNAATWTDALNGRFVTYGKTDGTISGGTVTINNRSYYGVDTPGGTAATGTLTTITGGTTGQLLILRAVNAARTVVVQDGTGNLVLAGDFSLDNTQDRIVLHFDGTNWCELSRSDNSA